MSIVMMAALVTETQAQEELQREKRQGILGHLLGHLVGGDAHHHHHHGIVASSSFISYFS